MDYVYVWRVAACPSQVECGKNASHLEKEAPGQSRQASFGGDCTPAASVSMGGMEDVEGLVSEHGVLVVGA